MGSESPNVILYDVNGQEMSVSNGSAIPAGTSALMIAGSDGTNSRFLTLDASGRLITVGAGTAGTPVGGVTSIQGVSGGTAVPISGSITITGTAAVTQSTSPWVDNITQFGGNNVVTGTGASGVGIPRVTVSNDSNILATQSGTWTVTATQATAANLRAQTASESTTATATGTVAALVGGAVTTGSPTYTTGQMDPLSLTTAGALRVDGSAVTQPISGTVTANAGIGTFTVAGTVTANAGTGNFNNASVSATGVAGPASATYIGGAVTTAAPTYTTGQMDPLSLDTAGNLRVNNTTADVTATGALGALNANVQLTLAGHTTAGFQLAAGTLIGTILAEVSFDGGTTWNATYMDNGNKVSTIVFGVANTATAATIVGEGGSGLVRVRVSAYTSGTANITIRASVVNDPSVVYAGQPNATAQPPTVAQVGGWDGTNLRVFNTTPINGVNPLRIQETDPLTATSYPDQGNYVTTGSSASTYDAFGNLQVRGPVFTDEGSLRDDFTGAALTTAITGNLTWTNGSVTVTGTTLQTQIRAGQYIKKTADAETLYVQVASVDTATSLTLVSAYTGTSAAAASVVSNWQTVTPTSGTGAITVATSIMTMGCGTTANGTGSIRSLGDYLPYSVQFYAEVSQRIINQTLYMGVQDVVGLTPNQQATVQFSGTVNTTVNFVTCFANTTADTQTTAVTLPNGGTTAAYHLYKIDLSNNQATLSIDGIVVAINTVHIPSPYTDLYITAGVVNGAVAPASNTNFLIDYVFFQNIDRIQIDTDFTGEPLPVATQQAYGVNNQTITITLNSLASTSQRQSTVVNNTSAVFRDALVQIQIKTAAAAVSTTGIVNIYAYGSANGGTNYGDTVTGTDGAVTLTSPPNLKIIGTINAVANATVYDSNPFSVAAVFGGKLPQYWGIVVENKTGAAFDATAGNFKAFYQGVLG